MSETKPPHHWRENIEALTMAIVVALLFKYFVLEISKIPSGSMQPTLMGDPQTEIYDRTVVDKLSFHFRDPERFEIVVFKHPLEESRVMVKRLVGMPGEQLRVEHGDLWTRANDDEPWRILRRPPSVVREMLRALPPAANGRDWSVVRGGKEWQIHGDAIVARGEGAARFHADAGPLKDEYYDGYPRALLADFMQRYAGRSENAVGDLRLEGELVAQADTRAVVFELTEGTHLYEFTLPGPAAEPEAEVRVRIRDSKTDSERVERGERFMLTAGARVSFALENIDDRLCFELDGRACLTAEIAASERQEASLTLSIAGGGADFSALRVARDVYYQGPDGRASWSVTIPAEHYVMLGDNTQDSADSRLWEAQSFSYRAGDELRQVRGNLRRGENPMLPSLDGKPTVRFKDQWGEVHWFGQDATERLSIQGVPAPFVPRELILGRAVAIFWPIWPLEGLWRVGWLR